MKYAYHDGLIKANHVLWVNELAFQHSQFSPSMQPSLTIAWNRSKAEQLVIIDGETYLFPSQSFMFLVFNQNFHFPDAKNIVIWQFDKPFYCIEDNDREVSCIGFLFWGNKNNFPVALPAEKVAEFDTILSFWISEFQTYDNIRNEVLRALLKRLIVKLYRLAREQQFSSDFSNEKLDIVRQFNVLVEKNFRTLHQVQDYAKLLFKSPKTLANLFAIYNHKTPLRVIHERIILEAKRLLIYTDMPVKEISETLGFNEISHFARLFKGITDQAPIEFREHRKELIMLGND